MVFNCFSIVERGKKRDIRACYIYDRMLQNALCETFLLPQLTPKLIYDNCATLKDKGIDFALKRVRIHLQKAHQDFGLGENFYAVRLDVKKYFDSIDHEYLKSVVRKYVQQPQISELVEYIIDTFCYSPTTDNTPQPDKQYYIVKGQYGYRPVKVEYFKPGKTYYEYKPTSLGLGSQASQLLALLALNEVDHYAKERLHLKYYGRYMDDIYFFGNDKEYLRECVLKIEQKLVSQGLKLNRKKTTIMQIKPGKRQQPFKYLKWNFWLTKDNGLIQLPFKEKIAKQRRKMRRQQKLWLNGETTTENIVQSYLGWRAHISKGNTFYLVQRMDNYFKSLFKGVDLCLYM